MPEQAGAVAADAPFTLEGRISARRGDAGVAGGFTWIHDARHDAIDLASPLCQTIARLEGDGRSVTVHLQDGRVESATTWGTLT
jgi:outer membrane lipoprotein LolB